MTQPAKQFPWKHTESTHALPQLPQLAESVYRLVQGALCEQQVSPGPHCEPPQTPAVQVSPLVQALPSSQPVPSTAWALTHCPVSGLQSVAF